MILLYLLLILNMINKLKVVTVVGTRPEIIRLSKNYNNEFEKMGPWLLKN